MSDGFSTSASHAFEHPELDDLVSQAGPSSQSMGDAVADLSIEEAFEVDDTVQKILYGGYKTIGLQFPDELLPSSVQVFKAIQKKTAHTGAQAYVLADSTYGSCCPDVLSCLHLPADFLVHYGHACLTPTDALPVHYVFPRRKLDAKKAAESLLGETRKEIGAENVEHDTEAKKGIIVVWDVAFDWLADEIKSTFTANSDMPLSFASIQRPSLMKGTGTTRSEKAPALRSIEAPTGVSMAECVLWYIGEEGRSLLNLQMTHSGTPLYAYSPSSDHTQAMHPTSSRLLSKRLYAVHQAMSSDIFGLIAGNVGLTHSQSLLSQLRSLLKKHRKKSYTLSVGRLNPAKLANFETIECFVLVGCAEGGVVDSKEFYRPIITPWELLLALQGPEGEWEPNKWTLDITSVLNAAEEQQRTEQGTAKDSAINGDGAQGDDDDDDTPQFSLITGAMRTPKIFGKSTSAPDNLVEGVNAMTVRNKDTGLIKAEESAGASYLAQRQFKGLEARVGMDEPAILEEGRGGIARGYDEEK